MDMDENENAKLLAMIDQILKENPGTNFERCFPQHFAIFLKYVDSARKKQLGCFPDRETYEAFSSAKLFFDKLKFAVFQKDDETQNIENEDFNIPPLEAFHNTVDEIEMKKNRILESINKGDVLHLKVIEEETEKYKLQILNKYGDKQRIIDLSLFANLLKYNPLVRNINPPLQIGDLVRAAAFGNVKTEEGEYKKLIVSLNPNVVTDNELKHLKLIEMNGIPFSFPQESSRNILSDAANK